MFSKHSDPSLPAGDDELRGVFSNDARLDRAVEFLQDVVGALAITLEAAQTVQLSNMDESVDFYDEVRRFEINLIKRALKLANGNQSQAARLLNLNQTTLHGKLKQYKISPVVIFSESDHSINPDQSDTHTRFVGAR